MATKRMAWFAVAVTLLIWLTVAAIPNIHSNNEVTGTGHADSGATKFNSFFTNWSWAQEGDREGTHKSAAETSSSSELEIESDAGTPTTSSFEAGSTVISTVTSVVTDTKTVTQTPTPTKSSQVFETVVPEIHHHIQINNATNARNLVLVATRHDEEWGHVDGVMRDVEGFLQLVKQTSGLPLHTISFAISTGNKDAYKKYISILSKEPFAKVQVVLYEPHDHVDEPVDRHAPEYQPIRRQQIALARNMLMLRVLGDEQHIFWYDSDIVWSENGMLAKMLEHSLSSTVPVTQDKTLLRDDPPLRIGLITARASEGGNLDYDLNAWAIRTSALKPDTDPDYKPFQRESGNMLHMRDFIDITKDNEIFPLDSVGGVVLYIRARLVRKGLNFPSYYVIGATWDHPNGGDGLETEGICYVARTMGYGCYGMGGNWHVAHMH